MPITATEKIWMNGELIPWDAAQIHILTHSLHYGMGVFEGIRAYETSDGPGVFRLTEHIERLHDSAKIMMMDLPYSVDELVQATKDVVRASGLPSCYIRPIAYYGYGEMGLNTLPCEVDVAVRVLGCRDGALCRGRGRRRPGGGRGPRRRRRRRVRARRGEQVLEVRELRHRSRPPAGQWPSRKASASSAAMQPVPADVTACR